MSSSESYVCFGLWGSESGPHAGFNPDEITEHLGIAPTRAWAQGTRKGLSGMPWRNGGWLWETARGTEPVKIDKLVDQTLTVFESKTADIIALKEAFGLESELKIVLYVDTNEEEPTPALGHDGRTINFLHTTRTTTDIDIYRYNSREAHPPAAH